MQDEYFGIQDLYQVILRAKAPMIFGERQLVAGEPVLYFENIKMATINESNKPIMARGGWQNMPQVIWEDRSEVQFTLSRGVISNTSLGILLNSKVIAKEINESILVPKREGPRALTEDGRFYLKYKPKVTTKNKLFIYEYARDAIQKKMYGKLGEEVDPLDSSKMRSYLTLYEDKEGQIPALNVNDYSKQYIIDYYYEYTDEALIYTLQKERFNGLFTLEGKFYSKDENEGKNYTNLIYMPKVRVVSDINLRLGERADPTTSVFHIIGLPEPQVDRAEGLIMKITHLNADID